MRSDVAVRALLPRSPTQSIPRASASRGALRPMLRNFLAARPRRYITASPLIRFDICVLLQAIRTELLFTGVMALTLSDCWQALCFCYWRTFYYRMLGRRKPYRLHVQSINRSRSFCNGWGSAAGRLRRHPFRLWNRSFAGRLDSVRSIPIMPANPSG